MNEKGQRYVIFLMLAMVATIIAYLFFIKTSYFETFETWAKANIFLYCVILIFIKIVGIVWPPLPGGVITIASIPILGWSGAYLTDLAGGIVGSIIAYFLARKWGKPFLRKIFNDDIIKQIDKIKLVPKHEIEGLFLLRIFGGSIVEIVCYGAGLLKARFWHFLLASISSHLVVGVPTFFFFNGLMQGKNVLINFIIVIATFTLLYKYKNKYFTYQK